jgi:DNA-binding NtrC family response regulator
MEVIRLNILLLDESPELLEQMKSRLEEQGFLTQTAQSLQEALQLIKQNTFDVVVTDATMPDNDGVALLKNKGSDIPFVMLSQNVETVTAQNLSQTSCCFLDKADLHHRLAKAVWTAFKRFKIDRQLLRDSELAA